MDNKHIVTDCNSVDDFITTIKEFNKKHPNSYWSVKDDPGRLRIGMEAIVENYFYHFTLNIASVKKMEGNLSTLCNIMKNYQRMSEAAEQQFIDALI